MIKLLVSRFSVLVLLLGAVLSWHVLAVEYVTEVDMFDDIPLVNAGTRLEQRLTEVPASVTIIDREMILASGATEIPHLFRLVPGFLSFSPTGNQFGVSARGISPEFPSHLEIMVNGRTVYQPALATMEWTTLGIDIKDIDHIEVVRGANTPTYGSNAFLGAIHIVTIDSLAAPKTSLRVVTGGIGTRDANVNYSDQLRDFSYSLAVGARSNDGFSDEGSNRDGLLSKYVRLGGIYTPTLSDEVGVYLGVSKSYIERPRRDVRGYHNREINSNYQQVNWNHYLDNGDVKLTFHHNYGQIEDDTVLGLLSQSYGIPVTLMPSLFPGKTDEVIFSDIRNGFSERYDLELEHTLAVNPGMELVWGGGVRLDRLQSQFLLGNNDVLGEHLYRLFGNLDWHFYDGWNANIGVMMEHNNIVDPFASPRLGLNYQLSAAQTLRASVTSGRRTPSVLSVNQNQSVTFADGTVIDQVIINDGKAEAERIDAFELGYLGYFLSGDLSLDVKLFSEQVRDVRHFPLQAASDANGFVFVRKNGLDWDTQGVEVQARYRPDEQWLFSWQYAYTNVEGISVTDISDQIPRHNMSLLAAYRPLPDWEVSGVLYHTSDMKWSFGDEVDAITRLDLRVGKKLRLGSWQGLLELIAQNVGDDYVDYRQENRFERRLFLRLEFDLD